MVKYKHTYYINQLSSIFWNLNIFTLIPLIPEIFINFLWDKWWKSDVRQNSSDEFDIKKYKWKWVLINKKCNLCKENEKEIELLTQRTRRFRAYIPQTDSGWFSSKLWARRKVWAKKVEEGLSKNRVSWKKTQLKKRIKERNHTATRNAHKMSDLSHVTEGNAEERTRFAHFEQHFKYLFFSWCTLFPWWDISWELWLSV